MNFKDVLEKLDFVLITLINWGVLVAKDIEIPHQNLNMTPEAAYKGIFNVLYTASAQAHVAWCLRATFGTINKIISLHDVDGKDIMDYSNVLVAHSRSSERGIWAPEPVTEPHWADMAYILQDIIENLYSIYKPGIDDESEYLLDFLKDLQPIEYYR
jgi:hypothetical protein